MASVNGNALPLIDVDDSEARKRGKKKGREKESGEDAMIFAAEIVPFFRLLSAVDGVLECLASGELDRLGGSNLDFLAGTRVASGALGAGAAAEAAETDQLHGLAFGNRFHDIVDDRVQGALSGCFRQVAFCRDCVYQFSFVHHVPFRKGPDSNKRNGVWLRVCAEIYAWKQIKRAMWRLCPRAFRIPSFFKHAFLTPE
jgi:hypothetical protein